jgi:hypothetical protein
MRSTMRFVRAAESSSSRTIFEIAPSIRLEIDTFLVAAVTRNFFSRGSERLKVTLRFSCAQPSVSRFCGSTAGERKFTFRFSTPPL